MGKMIRGQAGEGLSTSVQQGKISGISCMLSRFSSNSALSLSSQLSLRVANHPPSQPLSSKDKLALSTFVPYGRKRRRTKEPLDEYLLSYFTDAKLSPNERNKHIPSGVWLEIGNICNDLTLPHHQPIRELCRC